MQKKIFLLGLIVITLSSCGQGIYGGRGEQLPITASIAGMMLDDTPLFTPTHTAPIAKATHTTEFDTKNINRTFNLLKAADVINGAIIHPGEVFSFNEIVGPAEKADGYKLAKIFVRGKEKQGYGGGICQVSSTLYNAVDYAGLKIVERHAHCKRVYYVPEGRDAAVAWGSVDLKFKNTRDYPIMIICGAHEGKLTVSLERVLN